MRRIAKALTAAATACGVTAAAISSSHLTDPSVLAGVITSWVGVVGVWYFPNTDSPALD